MSSSNDSGERNSPALRSHWRQIYADLTFIFGFTKKRKIFVRGDETPMSLALRFRLFLRVLNVVAIIKHPFSSGYRKEFRNGVVTRWDVARTQIVGATRGLHPIQGDGSPRHKRDPLLRGSISVRQIVSDAWFILKAPGPGRYFVIAHSQPEMDIERTRAFRQVLNVVSILRHPVSARMRKDFRARSLSKWATAPNGMVDIGRHLVPEPLLGLRSWSRHPFSSTTRKAYRGAVLRRQAGANLARLAAKSSRENLVDYTPLAAAAQRVESLIEGSLYSEIMRRAAVHEPLIEHGAVDRMAVAPFYDSRHATHKAIRKRLPAETFGTVICVPWLRTGGADLVACLLAQGLLDVRPDEKVLILRTDSPLIDRPDWLPDSVQSVDISDLLGRLPQAEVEYMLYVVLLGLSPRRVINVNSRLCWQMMARFGARLVSDIKLYSYMFCWDQTEDGKKVGYPDMFFTSTAPFLTATLTDTEFLRRELLLAYRPPDNVGDKVVSLFSPARTKPWSITAAELSLATVQERPRQRVLWAGRLDRQKRFDIVQRVATLMPDVDFLCWGAALLDAPPNLSTLPTNIKLESSFNGFDDLPLQDADLWLFTSQWEGMPTTIIELAMRGMPMVGTSVGGVPELLNPETGWPVPVDSPAGAYVGAIREALSSADERLKRARAFQQRAVRYYTFENYTRQLRLLLDKEGVR